MTGPASEMPGSVRGLAIAYADGKLPLGDYQRLRAELLDGIEAGTRALVPYAQPPDPPCPADAEPTDFPDTVRIELPRPAPPPPPRREPWPWIALTIGAVIVATMAAWLL